MAKTNLSSMSVDALLRLRDDVGRVLSRRADELKQQLATLGEDVGGRGRRGRRVSAMKGRKVAPKYRNPKNRSETWAGRGAMPRWLVAEIKKGKKREDFAISRSAAKARRGPFKKSQRKRKNRSVSRRTTVKVVPASSTTEGSS
jgi:DNA-binding protein H-NS